MLNQAQLRPAAFTGLHPYMPPRTIERGPMEQRLFKCLDTNGVVERIDMDRPDAKFYRLYNESQDFFIRLENTAVSAHLDKTETIARWLKSKGTSINASLEGYPKPFDDHWHIFVYPFIHGRYLEPTSADMAALGTALATLHNKLQRHPQITDFRTETDAWLLQISGMRAKLADNRVTAGPYPDVLADLARDPNIDFVMHGTARIACHGDLNAGNVMWDTGAEKIIFLDFEDVTHSVLPPAFELARVIERQILVKNLSVTAKADAARAFLKAYGVGGPLNWQNILTAHVLRTCCILAIMEEQGIPVAPTEWQKFFDIYELILKSRPVFAALES
jgi:Ser/Thr protein kinase RdoA (MazF antagonist)